MARITVQDCLEHVDNRFELVMVAAKRARQLSVGSPAHVIAGRDKPTVVALREIAAGLIDKDGNATKQHHEDEAPAADNADISSESPNAEGTNE